MGGRGREAAEQIELLYGERWKQFEPLNENERFDVLRAAIGYTLSDETIALARLRERYAPKFADGPDARAFEVVSAPMARATANSRTWRGASPPSIPSTPFCATCTSAIPTRRGGRRQCREGAAVPPVPAASGGGRAAQGADKAPAPPNRTRNRRGRSHATSPDGSLRAWRPPALRSIAAPAPAGRSSIACWADRRRP